VCCRSRRYKLFNLAKTYNKNLTPGDVSGLASSVLLAGLAVPPYDAATGAATDAAAELERERTLRMASILGFSVVRSEPLSRIQWFSSASGSVWHDPPAQGSPDIQSCAFALEGVFESFSAVTSWRHRPLWFPASQPCCVIMSSVGTALTHEVKGDQRG